MKNNMSARRMINEELASRATNKKTYKTLKHHVPADEQTDLLIAFNCECSDPDCAERVPMTLKDYKALHNTPGRFVVLKGHVEPKVEKVKDIGDDAVVVEKFALS